MACPVSRVASSPLRTELTGDQRSELESRARSYTLPFWQVVRAKVVLMAADGVANNEIAERLGTSPQVVHRWRKRFSKEGIDGLADRHRSGRPRVFGAAVVMEVKALACELPAVTGVPLSRWSSAELARELVTREVVPGISAATVWRTLRKDAIRPWYYRSWIAPRDPDFAAKAARVLDLYASCFEDQALGDNEFVISADEKTSIQARCRCHPTLPPGRARLVRVEHEYERGGALAYLAAYDVHRARVFGRCEATTGIVPFGRLVEQVMSSEPYASAERVFWVVDNGSSHRGQASVDRLQGEWPTLRLVHLPVHASWLDQVEIYFSVVQRKVVSPNDFFDLGAITERLAGFEARYNAAARPFDWKFDRDDLDELLARIATHEPGTPLPLAAAA
jgi:transposase